MKWIFFLSRVSCIFDASNFAPSRLNGKIRRTRFRYKTVALDFLSQSPKSVDHSKVVIDIVQSTFGSCGIDKLIVAAGALDVIQCR